VFHLDDEAHSPITNSVLKSSLEKTAQIKKDATRPGGRYCLQPDVTVRGYAYLLLIW
ncbi:unnamed protein product, partial [Acidithrix sp. C25]